MSRSRRQNQILTNKLPRNPARFMRDMLHTGYCACYAAEDKDHLPFVDSRHPNERSQNP